MIRVFVGDNTYEIDRQVQAIVDQYGGEPERVDGSVITPEDVPGLVAGSTLFSDTRLIIMKDASHNTPVWSALQDWLDRGIQNELILIEQAIDKRTKTYKSLQRLATIVEANEWTERQAAQAESWLKRYAKETGVGLMNEQVGAMVQRAMVPADKPGGFIISQQVLVRAITSLALVDHVDDDAIDAVLPHAMPETVFGLIHVAIQRDIARVSSILDRLRVSSDPYMTLGFVMSQWSQLALVSVADASVGDVAQAISARPYVLQQVAGDASMLSGAEIAEHTHLLAGLDRRLKSVAMDPWDGLSSWLFHLATRG